MEDASQVTKWKDKIGDFWENSENFYPVQPYQPGKAWNSFVYESYNMTHMILLFLSLNQCIWSLFLNRNGELLMQMFQNAFLTATSSLRACLLNLFSTKTKRISNVILKIISVTILLKVLSFSFAYQTINFSCKILLQGSKQFNSNSLRKRWYSKTLATWTKRRKSTIKYW